MRVWGLAVYLSHGNFSYRRLSISSEVIHFVGSFKSASAVSIRAMASSSENGPKLGYQKSPIVSQRQGTTNTKTKLDLKSNK